MEIRVGCWVGVQRLALGRCRCVIYKTIDFKITYKGRLIRTVLIDGYTGRAGNGHNSIRPHIMCRYKLLYMNMVITGLRKYSVG